MAREIPAHRLPMLIDAAIRVFSRKGFRRAQMADIAQEAGVSPGSLYNYVESKEALFYLVIDQGFGAPALKPLSFPLPTPAPGAIVKRVAERFAAEAEGPALAAALKRTRAADAAAELGAIVRELYAAAFRTAHASTMLERSALDMPELADLFYNKIRARLISRLARFIELRMEAGQFRRVPHPAVAARLIVETVTWFARNRRGDPASHDISDAAAEETTVDFIVHSLAGADVQRPEPERAKKTKARAR